MLAVIIRVPVAWKVDNKLMTHINFEYMALQVAHLVKRYHKPKCKCL